MAIIEKLANFDWLTLQAILGFLHHLKTKEADESSKGYDGAAPAAPLFPAAARAANGRRFHGGR